MIGWIVFFVALSGALPLLAAEPLSSPEKGKTEDMVGPVTEKPADVSAGNSAFVDQDRDGVNDRFQDANGDGINDVTNKPYPHRFQFVDQDGDGINDLFVDRDGDGVNDLNAHFIDLNGDGICDNVIDDDGDGSNDITGLKYDHRSLDGFRYGRMDEERGAEHRLFIDEDGDGMNDSRHPGEDQTHPVEGMDLFIDEDGDGICDGRTFLGRVPRGTMAMPGMPGGEEDRKTPGHMGTDETGRNKHHMGGGR
ncbi:MAG: hypothetical protein O2954_09195 [bacterium]|nr:hypothetical protein [bacterium]